MELKPGYKCTEVGIIPNDWDVSSVKEQFRICAGGDLNPDLSVAKQDEVHPYPIYSNATTNRGLYGYCSYADHPACSITVTARGTLGAAAYRDHRYTAIGRVLVLEPRQEASGQFFTEFINSRIRFAVESTGVPQLTAPQIGSYLLAVPPFHEQRAIAAALNDVDALLDGLDRLIAKKRDLKQAARQQFLFGQTRLPGYEGEWEVKLVGDILAYERPDRHIVKSTAYSDNGDIPVLTANKAFILGYTTETFGVCADLPAIVFDDFTTDCKFATVPFKVKSSAIKLLRPRHHRTSLRFLFELMQLIRFPVGEHKRYYISEYQNIRVSIPDYEEQIAVVSVLSDMDAEIAALEARRDKTRDLKQAMMQELLTGKTRVAEPEAPHA